MGPDDTDPRLEGLLATPALRVLREVAAGRDDVVVSLHDPSGLILWASPDGAETLLGGTRLEPPFERSVLEVIHEADVARVRVTLGEVADGDTAEFEFRARHADGRWLRLRSVAWPLEVTGEDAAVIAVTVPVDRPARS